MIRLLSTSKQLTPFPFGCLMHLLLSRHRASMARAAKLGTSVAPTTTPELLIVRISFV